VDTSQDALLTQIQGGVEIAVAGYCKRTFEQTSYSEYYTGNNSPVLILNQYPVLAVGSVNVDLSTGNFGQTPGGFDSTTLLTAGTDYALQYDDSISARAGFLRRLGGTGNAWGSWPGQLILPNGLPAEGTLTGGRSGPSWLSVPGSIWVQYTAGYTAGTMPVDLMLAVDQVCAWVYRTGKWGGLLMDSEKLEDYSYSLATKAISAMPPIGSPRQILGRYRDESQVI
jgi:hypothetical protein